MEKSKINLSNNTSFDQQRDIFESLFDACGGLDAIDNTDQASSFFINRLSDIFQANKVSFMLLDEAKGELFLKAFQGIDPSLSAAKVKLGDSFSGRVAKEGKPLLVKDVEEEFPDLPRSRMSRYSSKSFVIVPVASRNNIFGVISLTDKKSNGEFSEADLKLLNILGRHFALYIENNLLIDKNKNLLIADPLTNLYNHRYFHEHLMEEIYRSERYKRPMSIMMVDVDSFSKYNESHGYSAGDNVLKQVAKVIKESVRQTDIVCRLGLDDFGIILPETKTKESIFVGEKIRDKINLAVFTEDEQRKSSLGMARLTVSIGIAEHKIGLNKEELVRDAAGALLEAQEKGRNCVCVFK